MRFIKKYESLVKKNDEKVINSLLLPLVDEIVKMLKTLAELQGYEKWNVKTYFSDGFYGKDSLNISIKYCAEIDDNIWNSNVNLFNIKISTSPKDNKNYNLIVETQYDDQYVLELARKFNNFMSKYVSEENYLYRGGRNEFTKNDINDIIINIKKLIPELELEISTKKYNI